MKDNIDVAGMPTTAACPDYAYQPTACLRGTVFDRRWSYPCGQNQSRSIRHRPRRVRSPYGVPINPALPDRIPGGSSSGNAIALACRLVSFALGTDTAGSGRVRRHSIALQASSCQRACFLPVASYQPVEAPQPLTASQMPSRQRSRYLRCNRSLCSTQFPG